MKGEEITFKSRMRSGRVWKVRFECGNRNALLILQYAWRNNAETIETRKYRI